MENPTAEGRYKEHSIVRVELSNFQNYDHVVFRPGPRLNLVVGPNGSGKSAIVNAIALVLGADPKVLGRGSKISGFVTNGQSQGAVEIELRNPSGPNLVIKRVINSDNKSQYSLNGKNATEMVVKKRLEKAKIQVANLCTFLPQDKVGNFSKFTPQELLAETQKTIDQEDLYEVHCKLIEMQESSLSRLREEESLTTAVGNMRKRCENLQRDVKRFKDREEAREAIDLLEKRKLWVEFLKYQEHLKIVALEKKEAKEKLEEAQGKDEPMQQALEGMNKELAQAKAFCKRAAKEEMEEDEKIKKADADFEKSDDYVDTAKNSLKRIENTTKSNEAKLKDHERKAADLEKTISSFDQDSPMRALREADDAYKKLNTGPLVEAQFAVNAAWEEKNHAMHDLTSAQRRLAQLQNLSNQKLVAYKTQKNAPLFLDIRQWLLDNQEKFTAPVYGPVALELGITDPALARCIENTVSNAMLNGFVTSSFDDYKTLTKHLKQRKTACTVYNIEGGRLDLSMRSKYTPAEVEDFRRKYGDVSILEEAYTAPDAVKQLLRDHVQAHNIIVGGPEFEANVTKLGNSFLEGVTKGGGVVYGLSSHDKAAQIQSYKVTKSRYNQIVACTADYCRFGGILATGADPSLVDEVERNIHDLQAVHDRKVEQVEMAKSAHEQLKEQSEGVRQEMKEAENELQRQKDTRNELKKSRIQIKKLQEKLQMDSGRQREEAIKKCRGASKMMQKNLVALVTGHKSLCRARIEYISAHMEIEHLEASVAAHQAKIKAAQSNLKGLKDRVERASAEYKHVKTKAQAALARANKEAPIEGPPPDKKPLPLKEKLAKLPEDLTSLNEMIRDKEELLERYDVDNQIVAQYEVAKASLVEQEKELQKVVQQNASVMADMINLKNPWKTALDNAVKNLSTKFEKYMKDMGCSGEVKLNCADTGMAEEVMKPFKDWGLEIRVAFRDIREEARREALSVLSANQHSGGECSVSTILFLMALQSFNTSTPFCVVDEINQGMDEVNERLAFSRIVLNSCSRECDSQYFLITPKLLQGLTAMENEDVTVLFVFNGPWVPRGGGANFLLKEFAKKKKKKEVEDGADGRGTKRARIR